MAAAKTPAKPKGVYTDKSKSEMQPWAITILVEDQSTSTKPYIIDYFHEQLDDDYDRQYGDWAIRAVKLTPEQFKEAYESI